MPENGGAVASANSDNLYLPNHPGSEEVTQKTCRKTNRMIQKLDEPDGHVSGSPYSRSRANRMPRNPRSGSLQANAAPRNIHGYGCHVELMGRYVSPQGRFAAQTHRIPPGFRDAEAVRRSSEIDVLKS